MATSAARKSRVCSGSDSAANIRSSCGSHGMQSMRLSQKPLRKDHSRNATHKQAHQPLLRAQTQIPICTATKLCPGNYQMPCCRRHQSRRRCRIQQRPVGRTGPAAASSGPSDRPWPAALPACAPPASHIPLQPHSLTRPHWATADTGHFPESCGVLVLRPESTGMHACCPCATPATYPVRKGQRLLDPRRNMNSQNLELLSCG